MIGKGLVFGIMFSFLIIAVQPVMAIDIEQYGNSLHPEKTKPSTDIETKRVLFETIVEIAKNPDVKDILNKNEHDVLSSGLDFKDLCKLLFVKNPGLVLSVLFKRPKMTYDSLNNSYNKGVDVVNMLGEDKVTEITRSSGLINQGIIDELIFLTKDSKELSSRIMELDRLNSEMKKDSPFENYPVICALLTILDAFLVSSLALILLLILMMPGKLLWGFLTIWLSIFFIQFYTVTYLIALLQCFKS